MAVRRHRSDRNAGVLRALAALGRRRSGAGAPEYALTLGIVLIAALGIAAAAGVIRVDFETIACSLRGTCVPATGPGAPGETPEQPQQDRLAFRDESDVPLSTDIVSQPVLLDFASLPDSFEVTVSGADAQLRLDEGAWSAGPLLAAKGQSLSLRVTSSDLHLTPVIVRASAGALQADWTVTTIADANAEQPLATLFFRDVLEAEPGQYIESEIVLPVGFTEPLEVSIVEAGGDTAFRLGGQEWVTEAATIAPGQSIQLRQLAALELATERQMQIRIGDYTVRPWTVRTRETDLPEDTTLDGLAFPAIDGAEPGHIAVSAARRLLLPQAMSVSVAGDATAEMQIDGGDWTAVGQTVQPGRAIRLRLLAAPDYATLRSMTVTIGTESFLWEVTTRPRDDTPTGLNFGYRSALEPGQAVMSGVVRIDNFDGPLTLSLLDNDLNGRIAINGNLPQETATVVPGDLVQLHATAPDSFDADVPLQVQAGSLVRRWTLRTRVADRSPDNFAFPALRDQLPGADVDSAVLDLVGFDGDLPATLAPRAGATTGAILLVDGLPVDSGTAVSVGQTLHLRATVPAIGLTSCFTVEVGDRRTDWCVSAADVFAFRSASDLDPDEVVQSNSIGVPVSDTPLVVTLQGPASASIVIDGEDTGSRSRAVTAGERLAIQAAASDIYGDTLSVSVAMGAQATAWQLTTRAEKDVTLPDAVSTRFAFVPLQDRPLGTAVLSNIVAPPLGAPAQLVLESPVAVQLRLRNGADGAWSAWQAAPATQTLQPGEQIQLQMTTGQRYYRTEIASAQLNGETALWAVTTVADPASGGGSDGDLAFAPLTGLSVDTRVASNIVRLAAAGTLTLAGDGLPAMRRQRDGVWSDFTAGSLAVADGDLVQLAATTAALAETVGIATVSLDGAPSYWLIATGTAEQDSIASSFTFRNVTNAPIGAEIASSLVALALDGERRIVLSGEGNPRLRIQRAGIWGSPMAGGGSVQDGDIVQLILDAAPHYATLRTAIASVGTVSARWGVTTQAVPIDGVDAGSFAAAFQTVPNADPAAAVQSNAVIFTGLSEPMTLGLAGDGSAALILDGQNVGASATVRNGSMLRLQATAAEAFGGSLGLVLTASGWGDAGWTVVTRGRDTAPDPFALAPRLLQPVGSTQTASATVTGFDGTLPVQVAADAGHPGNPQIRVGGGAWQAASGPALQIASGQLLELSVIAPAQAETAQGTRVTIGSAEAAFEVTTQYDAVPAAIAFDAALDVEPGTLVRSTTVTLSAFVGTVSASVSGEGMRLTVNGVDGGTSATLSPGDRLALFATAPTGFAAALEASVAITGLAPAGWSVTTRAAVTAPTGLSLADVTDAAPSTRIVSAPVTLGGFDGEIALSIAGQGNPQLRLNGGPWQSGIGRALPRDVLELSLDSDAAFETVREAVLQAGSAALPWRVTTRAVDLEPDFPAIPETYNAQPGVDIASTAVSVTGFDGSLTASIAASGASGLAPRLIVGTTTYAVGQSAPIVAGQSIQALVTAPNLYDQSVTVTVTVGGVARQWALRTGPDNQPSGFNFNARQNIDPLATVSSNIVTICDFNTPLLVTLSVDVEPDLLATLVVDGAEVGRQIQISPGSGNCSAADWPSFGLRMQAVDGFARPRRATVTVGPYAQAVWSVTTRDANSAAGGLAFAVTRNAALGQPVDSEPATLTGFDGSLPVTVVPVGEDDAGPHYAIARAGSETFGAWVAGATAGTVSAGDRLKLRMTASSTMGAERSVKAIVGTRSAIWSASTVPQTATPSNLAFTTVRYQDASTLVRSNAARLEGITVPLTVSLSVSDGGPAPQLSIDGGATFVPGPVTVAAGDVLQLQALTSAAYSTIRAVSVRLEGEESGGPVATTKTWSTVTRSVDNTPDSFAFSPNSFTVDAGEWVESPAVSVTGFDQTQPLQLTLTPTGGVEAEVAIQTGSSGAWSAWAQSSTAPVAIAPGDAMKVRLQASPTYGQTRRVTARINNRSADLTAITRPLSADPFAFPARTGLAPGETVQSDAVVLTGWRGPQLLTPTGSGTPQIAVQRPGGTWSAFAASQSVEAGDAVRLQVVMDTDFGVPRTVALAIGTTVGQWVATVTTGPDIVPAPFAFQATLNAGVSTGTVPVRAVSQDALVQGFDEGVSLTAFATGPGLPELRRFDAENGWTAWSPGRIADVRTGNRIQIRAETANDYLQTRTVTVDLGGVQGSWTYTTGDRPNTEPEDFAFPPSAGAAPSTRIQSQAVTLRGLAVGVGIPLSVSGPGAPLVSINGRAPVDAGSGGSLLYVGDTVAVTAETAADYDIARTVTVALGTRSATWTFSTRAAPDLIVDALQPLSTAGRPINSLELSPIWTISGLESGLSVPVSVNGAQGAAFTVVGSGLWVAANDTAAAVQVRNGDRLQLRMTSAGGYLQARQAVLSVGTVQGRWTLTTGTEPSRVPDAFTFAPVPSAAASQQFETAEPMTVSGLGSGVSVPVTVAGHSSVAFRIEGQANWIPVNAATVPTVANGARIALRMTSAEAGGASRQATLTVGTRAGLWTVTTAEPAGGLSVRSVDNAPLDSTVTSPVFTLPGGAAGTLSFGAASTGYRPTGDEIAVIVNGVETRAASSLTYCASGTRYLQDRCRVTVNVPANAQIAVRTHTDDALDAVQRFEVAALGQTAIWTVATRSAGDNLPDAISFAPVDGAPFSAAVDSDEIVLSGFDPQPASSGLTLVLSWTADSYKPALTGARIAVLVNGVEQTASRAMSSCTGSNHSNSVCVVRVPVQPGIRIALRTHTDAVADARQNFTVTMGAMSTTWTVVSRGGPDRIPDPFSFAARDNVPLDPALVESEEIVLSGFEVDNAPGAAKATMTMRWTEDSYRPSTSSRIAIVQNGTERRANSAMSSCYTTAYASQNCTVSVDVAPGDRLRLRTYVDRRYDARQRFVIALQGLTTHWTVTTRAAPDIVPDPFHFAAVENAPVYDGTSYNAIQSEEIVLAGFEKPADGAKVQLTMRWAADTYFSQGYSANAYYAVVVNGSVRTADSMRDCDMPQTFATEDCIVTVDVEPGSRIALRTYPDREYGARQHFIVRVGDYTTDWYATTRPPLDAVPDPFTIPAAADAGTSRRVESLPIQLTGFDAPIDLVLTMDRSFIPNRTESAGVMENAYNGGEISLSACRADANACTATYRIEPGDTFYLRTYTDGTAGAKQRFSLNAGGVERLWVVTQ